MRLLLASAVVAVCVAAPLRAEDAKPGPMNIGHGIICDTSEQAIRFVTLRNEGSEAAQAIQLINREADNPTACGAAMIVFRVEEEMDEHRLHGKAVKVTRVVISAVSDGAHWARVPDIVQYVLVMPEGTEV
jgi:hypothetical protein